MSTDEIKSLREELLGPEETLDDLIKKRKTAENLLSHLELDYQKKREEHSELPPVWFDTKAIISSALAAIFVLVIGILFGFFYNMQFDLLKMVVPLSVGIAMIPLIIFSAKNNYDYQRMNAALSSRLSEMMSIRSKITLLQEKHFELSPISDRTEISPIEIRKDIIVWLEKILSYLDSIIAIPGFESQNPEAIDQAKQIIIKAKGELITPKWRTLPESARGPFIDADLEFIYGEFERLLSDPDLVDIHYVQDLRSRIHDLLPKYRSSTT
jgi:hypothetical protein